MESSNWIEETVGLRSEDASLPAGLRNLNVTLNRRRLAEFLQQFEGDSDVRDLLLLDLLGVATETEISSTGETNDFPALSFRPFRLWEYTWLYKGLGLADGGHRVLDLGGPASHLVIAAALAGNRVETIDLNPAIVEAGIRSASVLGLDDYCAASGDMRDLGHLASDSVDRIICCSVLEHLDAQGQRQSLSEMARLLAPEGLIGLTFDYGIGARDANSHLPPPHEPPANPEDIRDRYVHSGLQILGNDQIEEALPGSLFGVSDPTYTIASLFLGKGRYAPDVPSPVFRKPSLLSGLRIPALPGAVYKKAHRDRSRQMELSYWKDATEERLKALQKAEAELRRQTLVIEEQHRENRRSGMCIAAQEQRIRVLQSAADERLKALEETDRALRRTLEEQRLLEEKFASLDNAQV
jgi:2-polyprenyl-3-methyl-5-hydroxy-6-metoxy-1,4-benzoquinol methylase